MARNENMIAALKRERAIYVNAGDEDRIKQVDDSLRHYGYDPDNAGDDSAPAGEGDGPQGRTSTPQQTADQGKQKRAPRKTTAAPESAGSPAVSDSPPVPPAV
ncbi:hypothetical protein [Streptomyces longwoodensis]|uniref:hypothetical protein n=1 Tax=Streptomyces longwoodensis TaxID=68231 RepID=UPI0036EE135C